MAATIRHLKTKPQTVREGAREQLILALERFDHHRSRRLAELTCELRHELLREQNNEAASAGDEWTFVMISPTQHKTVVHWLKNNAERPLVALTLWAELFDHLDKKTGEILASRGELAALVETTPQEVSRVMTQLEAVGVVSKRRVPANGPVRYFMSPKIGTHLSTEARKLAQRDAPKLKLLSSTGKPRKTTTKADKTREPA